jgi:mRNA-degrading endonuclease RelE of RelBE toxin-antitoxin system
MFRVFVKKKALKDAEKMPVSVQENLAALLEDLREKGPVQPGWPNYSRIGKEMYHCHLARKWVACWYCEDKKSIIEVYYAGSRENAPY